LIAYVLLMAVLAAAITLIVWARRNSHHAKYLRQRKREIAARDATAASDASNR